MRGLKRPLLELSESEVNAHAPRQLNVSPLHKDDATPPVSRATQTHVPLVRRLLARRLLPASQNLISALDGMELHSRPQDILNRIWFKSPDADVVATPFAADCARTCSLSAIADEAGLVSIFDHEPAGEASWKPIVRFRTNRNAIFDIQWSLDDKGLAVATAEKSATIIDIPTATTTHRLRAHKSTVKTVRFHPSKASVVASAGRDGSIAIWDLRCRSGGAGKGCEGCDVPSLLIGSAHASGTKLDHASSITGLAFVSETALASASAQDDVVRTWDIRNARSDVKNRRRRPTDQSPKTSVVRQHGLTALCPSRDGARLFAISRDSRVHEYELISLSGGPSRTWQLPRTTISTFYCKAAVSKDDILCVGASDGKPTFVDVSRISRAMIQEPNPDAVGLVGARSPSQTIRRASGGHNSECTDVAWSHDDSTLLTIGDDCRGRIWRRDRNRLHHRAFVQMEEPQRSDWVHCLVD